MTSSHANPESGIQSQPNPRFPAKQIAMLLAVFIAGGLFGATLTVKNIHSRMQQFRQHPEVLRGKITMRLQKKLKLNSEQTVKVREIFERRHSKIVALHKQFSDEILVEFNAIKQEITLLLHEDQISDWQKLSNRVRERYLAHSEKMSEE